jgi:ankyrin repeat protein
MDTLRNHCACKEWDEAKELTASASKEELTGMLFCQNGKGWTVLLYACRNGIPLAILQSMFTSIINKGIDLQSILAINAHDNATPLHWAARGPSVDVVKLIVQYSSPAILNVKDNNGDTPLALARKGNRENNVKFLEEVSNIDMQYIIIKA